MNRKLLAAVVLVVAMQALVWSGLFALGSFGRAIQLEESKATWEGVREFATIGTLVIDGLVYGAMACVWAIVELEMGDIVR